MHSQVILIIIGFGKFELGGTKPRTTKQTKQEPPPNRGGGGRPDPGKKGWDKFNEWFSQKPPDNITTLGILMGAGFCWYLLTKSTDTRRRISWKEFRTNYLEQGEV